MTTVPTYLKPGSIISMHGVVVTVQNGAVTIKRDSGAYTTIVSGFKDLQLVKSAPLAVGDAVAPVSPEPPLGSVVAEVSEIAGSAGRNNPVAWVRTVKGWHCTSPWMNKNYPWEELHWRSGDLTVLHVGANE